MGALDEPVRTLLAEPGRRRMHLLLSASETAGAATYTDAYNAVSRAEGGTVRQAFAYAGIRDLGGIPEQLRVFEKADEISSELAQTERKLLESAPASGPVDFARARRLDLRYAGPEGRQVWERDLELNPDLPVMLEQRALQASSRGALNARLRKLSASVNDQNLGAGEKLRMLDSHRSEGLRELDQATGNNITLDRPPGGGDRKHGPLVALDSVEDMLAHPGQAADEMRRFLDTLP